MYADVDARGGILEPPGIVEVKYRQHQQVGHPMGQGGFSRDFQYVGDSWKIKRYWAFFALVEFTIGSLVVSKYRWN